MQGTKLDTVRVLSTKGSNIQFEVHGYNFLLDQEEISASQIVKLWLAYQALVTMHSVISSAKVETFKIRMSHQDIAYESY